MSRQRGDVVVRVRSIEEDLAGAAAARAKALADAAQAEAVRAASRAQVHPLHGRGSGLRPGELVTASGVASALREAALSAHRRAELAQQSLDSARSVVLAATAQRKAAERLVERRIAEVDAAARHRDQRTLDEFANLLRGPR